jgi:GNAT superfamily N-acetyltransferase
MSSVEFRPFEEDDFESLSIIYGKLWCDVADEDERRLFGAVAVATYLSISPHSIVAEHDGRAVGCALGRMAGEAAPSQWRWHRDLLISAADTFDPELTRRMRDQLMVDRRELEVAAAYLQRDEDCASAELNLLMVDPSAKGLGIGGRLFDLMRQELSAGGAEGFFLMTDDECDFTFYDHKGLSRLESYGSRTVPSAGGKGGEVKLPGIYIYGQMFQQER